MAAPAATSSARRLLPAPPGPVIVTSRATSARRGAASTRASASCSAHEPVVERGEARRRERLERRELLSQIGRHELEELRRARDVLQAVSTERAERRSRERLVARRCRGSPARRRSARRARRQQMRAATTTSMSHVALVAELRLARVDSDAQTMRLVVRPRLGGERALDLGRGGDRICALGEREEDAVACPVDLARRRARAAASRTSSRMRARAGANRSPRSVRSRVEPSTSAKSKRHRSRGQVAARRLVHASLGAADASTPKASAGRTLSGRVRHPLRQAPGDPRRARPQRPSRRGGVSKAMREIRLALLEADVNLEVARTSPPPSRSARSARTS